MYKRQALQFALALALALALQVQDYELNGSPPSNSPITKFGEAHYSKGPYGIGTFRRVALCGFWLVVALLGSGMVLDGSRNNTAAGLLEAQRIWLHLRLWKHWTLIKWHLPSCLKTVQRKKESRTCSGAIREKH